jgi:hypothetical protein
MSVWGYSSYQTSGLIEKRYANQDALGRSKKSNFSGREEIAKGEKVSLNNSFGFEKVLKKARKGSPERV